jgi:hypothetical protein
VRRAYIAGRWEECLNGCLGLLKAHPTDMIVARVCLILADRMVEGDAQMRA